MKGLADRDMQAVERGEVRLLPDNMPAIFNEWMRNIQDWCISRQTWWGHRIPVWHCAKGHYTVPASGGAPDPTVCGECREPVTQDPDTLDTWFTSCLWPFGILGWPDEQRFSAAKAAKLYPTTILVTGWDILFFWVSRMIMMGLHYTGEAPFRTVVLNSLVADPEGKKMSKSKGNVIDPLDLFDRFGTDASRFALTRLETLRETIRVSEERVEHGRNFMNKLWNAARFTLGELEGFTPSAQPPANLSLADKWILSHAAFASDQATGLLARYEFGSYALLTEEFVWHSLCDTYIELAKPALKDAATRPAAQWTLWRVLDTTLRIMHPAVPFVTEEIWQRLPHLPPAAKFLMLESWPAGPAFTDDAAKALVGSAINVAEQIRALKHEQGLATNQEAEVAVLPADPDAARQLTEALRLGYVQTLTRATVRVMTNGDAPPQPSVSAVIPGYTLHLKLEVPADPAAERQRLVKERDALQTLLNKTRGTLANADYLAKAPPALVADSRKKAEDYAARLARLAERLRQLA
ncbi:MAG: class I tRNA ligase family protein [bacterium]